METFFVRSSMNETPLDHWIAGKEAPIFPPTERKEDSSPSGASAKCLAVIRQIKTVPGYMEMVTHGLGNMVASFLRLANLLAV